jgi:hypothetical protein
MLKDSQIITDLAKVEVAVKRCKEEYDGQMKMLLSDLFKKFFAAVPEIKTIQWDQYTGGIFVELEEDGAEEEFPFILENIGFNMNEYNTESYDEDDCVYVVKTEDVADPETTKVQAMIAVQDILVQLAEPMKKMLGDHVVCYATINGIFVENFGDDDSE